MWDSLPLLAGHHQRLCVCWRGRGWCGTVYPCWLDTSVCVCVGGGGVGVGQSTPVGWTPVSVCVLAGEGLVWDSLPLLAGHQRLCVCWRGRGWCGTVYPCWLDTTSACVCVCWRGRGWCGTVYPCWLDTTSVCVCVGGGGVGVGQSTPVGWTPPVSVCVLAGEGLVWDNLPLLAGHHQCLCVCWRGRGWCGTVYPCWLDTSACATAGEPYYPSILLGRLLYLTGIQRYIYIYIVFFVDRLFSYILHCRGHGIM